MAYDSDGSFDIGDAPAPDAAASAVPAGAASAANTALAMEAAAAAAMSSAAPPPSRAALADDGWRIDPGPGQAFAPTQPALGDDDDDWPSDADEPPRRRRGGLVGAIKRFLGLASAEEARVAELQAAVRRARQLHPHVGHQCTAEVAAQLGHPELDGMPANQQLATLRARWREIGSTAAAELAERGRLVVAGLEGAGNSGHTAIVVPGPGAMHDGRFFPNVAGGGLPLRRSDGSRCASDVWTPSERRRVAYFTPRG